MILKTSGFFLEEDDKKQLRDLYEDQNIKANEYLYRRVDIEDAVSAHLLALDKVCSIGFGKYIISATTLFSKSDIEELTSSVAKIVNRYFSEFNDIYESKNGRCFQKLAEFMLTRKRGMN